MSKSPHLQTLMMQFAEQHRFFNSGAKVLAAVSGGVDSMVMLHLLHQVNVNTVAAHCNFGLRGDESNFDEAFVKTESHKLGIECQVAHFDASSYAVQKGYSVQMAARELRYRWFNELLAKENFDAIAIAHNRDDRIETLLINLARGTGIHGLTSIKPVNGNIIRPLLFASRNEIEVYAKAHNVLFREDSSNATDKYARNYIRHHVIPGLEQYFPGMRKAIERNLEHYSEVELFYNAAVEYYKNQIVTFCNDLIYINMQGLAQSPSPPALLYEILKSYGFSNSTASEILENQNYTSGRQFYSNTHRLVNNRQSLIIQKIENTVTETSGEYLIDEHTLNIDVPIRMKIKKFEYFSGFEPETTPNIAYLDSDKLQFPLLLRKWKHGDRFRPLGMHGMKKLSDFFSDNKLSLIEKEKSWVLVSGEQIAWIVGMRIDDRFKITDKTRKVIRYSTQF